MKMIINRLSITLTIFLVAGLLTHEHLAAQGLGGQDQQVRLVLKMYQVEDILNESIDQPFEGFSLPGVSASNNTLSPIGRSGGGGSFGGGSFGGGGFGGGGGGGANGGGGVFSIPVGTSAPPQLGGGLGGGGFIQNSRPVRAVTELIDSIQVSISPDSWNDIGNGLGTITYYEHVLIVNQTAEIHQALETYFQMLRQAQAQRKTITVKAVWLTIDEEQFASLELQKDQRVNRAKLNELVATHGRRTQITCLDGQLVYIASGNLKNSVESVVPVVGQKELHSNRNVQFAHATSDLPATRPSHVMAQMLGGQPDTNSQQSAVEPQVGYTPIVRWINFGTVLQIKPSIEQGSETITLNVASSLVLPNVTLGEFTKFPAGIDLTQHDLRCQQFHNKVRMPDSTPVLVGGATFPSTTGKDQTYLILESIVNQE